VSWHLIALLAAGSAATELIWRSGTDTAITALRALHRTAFSASATGYRLDRIAAAVPTRSFVV
jgi:hypothetical protein